jgi:undecaprenyl-diphosphatase
MAAYAEKGLSPVGVGLLVLAVLLLGGWLVARHRPEGVTGALWGGLGALVALGAQQLVAPALDEARPYRVLRHVELLVPASGAPLPDARTAMAGAVVTGLYLARRHGLASIALVAALLLAFARVYVGADYPADVAAGLGFGVAVELVLWPLGGWLLGRLVEGLAAGPLGVVVAAGNGAPKPSRRVPALRLSQVGAPNARVIDALKTASEAARNANYPQANSPSRQEPGAPGSTLSRAGEGLPPTS